jgi:cell division septation protein DedD
MSDESVMVSDDQSHYEISLTAGQAFIAFVLLLLSLAASFTFGLMIGKGQGDDRLVVRKEPAVVTEANAVPRKPAGKIVELGVADDDFKQPAAAPAPAPAPAVTETPVLTEQTTTAAAQPAPAATTATPASPVSAPATPSVPFYAQLLSTTDQKTAEALAAKLINGGFTAAYVERSTNEKGTIFRVRVKFPSEAEARAAEAKLREFAKEVWITR